MRKWFSLCLIFLGVTLVGWGIFNLAKTETSEGKMISPWVAMTAPSEEFLWRFRNGKVSGVNWQPELALGKNSIKIDAKAAAVVDLTDNKMIFAKNLDEEKPIASLTKIMTAVLALNYGDLQQEILISKEAASAGEAFMGIEAGEKFKLLDLIYGMMLPSGNDAAEAVAEGLAGKREVFIKLMNEEAKRLGLNKTRFVNPSGLDEESGEVCKSSGRDLARLSHYAWTNFPKFAEIVGTKEWTIAQTENHKQYHLVNTLGLEETYPGMKGIKPGNTWEAGYCLIGLAEQKGHEILVVLLDTPSPKNEVVELFDWAFKQVKN